MADWRHASARAQAERHPVVGGVRWRSVGRRGPRWTLRILRVPAVVPATWSLMGILRIRMGRRSLRILAAAVTASVLASVLAVAPVAAQSGPFIDVSDNAYYSTPVAELDAAGVFDGTARHELMCPNGFCPNDPIDRKTIAVWVVRVLDGQDPSDGSSGFDDVDRSLPVFWTSFIRRLAELGITNGCGDGSSFCPNRSTTRAEMAAFLSRAFELPDGPDPGFSDVPGDAWYASDVARLRASGITAGCGDGTSFCPNRTTTRAEMATFLHRAIARIQPDNGLTVPSGVDFRFGRVWWLPVSKATSYDVTVCTNEGCATHRMINCCDWTFGDRQFNSIRVRAVNSAGKSDWSKRVDGPPEQVPTAPTGLTFSAGRAVWAPVPGAIYYDIEWLLRDVSTYFRNVVCLTHCTLATEIDEGQLRVRAGNDAGWSQWSNWTEVAGGPRREVEISLGEDRSNCPDLNKACRWLKATLTGFASGQYRVQCVWSLTMNGSEESFADFTVGFDDSYSPVYSELCYFNGSQGRYLTVYYEGVRSNTIRFEGTTGPPTTGPDTAALEQEAKAAVDEARRIATDVEESVKLALQVSNTQAISADLLAHWVYESIDGTNQAHPTTAHVQNRSRFVAAKTLEIQTLTRSALFHPGTNNGGTVRYVEELGKIAHRAWRLAGTDDAWLSSLKATEATLRTVTAVQLARSLRVWAKWSEYQASLACTDFLRFKLGEIVHLTTLGLYALGLATGIAKIVIFGLKALALVVLEKVGEWTLEQIVDHILSPPYNDIVNAVVFMSPPNPADNIGDGHVIDICVP